jgi:hypothetical protein
MFTSINYARDKESADYENGVSKFAEICRFIHVSCDI